MPLDINTGLRFNSRPGASEAAEVEIPARRGSVGSTPTGIGGSTMEVDAFAGAGNNEARSYTPVSKLQVLTQVI
jgi:hypothetical protein